MGATSGKCLPSRASEHFERATSGQGGQGRVMRPGEYANGTKISVLETLRVAQLHDAVKQVRFSANGIF